jgi:pimeloyl-ACP methyl ester carboxylesterase
MDEPQYPGEAPLVVMLHWLGGSAQTWTEVAGRLRARGLRCEPLDLPGFGEAAGIEGFTVEQMAAHVMAEVQRLRPDPEKQPWLLAGHSMGGKVAAVVAREAAKGTEGLQGLRGLMLVSPSPPTVEPMEDSTRRKLLDLLSQSTGDPEEDRKHAAKFVDDNIGKLPLPADIRDRTIDDVLRMNRAAFRAWLESGSNEDWADRVGVLPLPVVVMAGSEEPALGPDVQREKTLPHFERGEVVSLEGAAHLGPLERSGEVADRMLTFMAALGLSTEVHLRQTFMDLIDSDRTSEQTRSFMLRRITDGVDSDYQPVVVSQEGLATLRAVAEAVVPGAGFDLGVMMDKKLAAAQGDGWRFDPLPPNPEAWRLGLESIDAAAHREFSVPFRALDGGRQGWLLEQAGAGKLGRGLLGTLGLGEGAGLYNAEQMQLWFEDVRGDFVRLYLADPRGLQRIGFTGFADEGGFTQIQLENKEELV